MMDLSTFLNDAIRNSGGGMWVLGVVGSSVARWLHDNLGGSLQKTTTWMEPDCGDFLKYFLRFPFLGEAS